MVFFGDGRVNSKSEVVRIGHYAELLRGLFDIFPKEQVLVLDGENFKRRPWEEIEKVRENCSAVFITRL